ncbi:pro-neuregulin-1%2C membrane-bound isoform isoform X1 [Scomber scombrus]|uniref:Pro-neuregulin-1, membrane-bound isoform isoform X1 n=1 Tax=Scomber scombrus TaxID=13677 RepID=A0AAV1PWN9_SCOSC
MTEGMDDFSAGPASTPGSASPTGYTFDTGQVPEEKPEETEAAGESGEEGTEGTAEGGGNIDGEHSGALGIVALPGTCCVCIEMEQINNCLHSEKICILPILACLLSLALCTAGLKWVFVDKIFEYEPPTHLDPKRIGQDPIIISVDPTLGLTVSIPHSSPSTVSLTTAIAISPGHPEVLMEEKSKRGPYVSQSPGVTLSDPSVTLKFNAEHPTVPKQTPHPQTTQELNNIFIPTISPTSTTTTAKTSSHVTRCSDSQKNYCVNGGECFTLEIMPGSTKFLCRCPNEFTGDRCQNYVMASFYKAEELYQKRILTITGICIALLVVGIMCVVAYCKTKKHRRKLHDRLRQNLRKKRNNLASSARGRQISNLPLQDLQLINHAAEKETDITLSTSKYAISTHEPTTLTHISSQSWSNDWSNSVLSDTESISMMSLAENSQEVQRHTHFRQGLALKYEVCICCDNPNLAVSSVLHLSYISRISSIRDVSPPAQPGHLCPLSGFKPLCLPPSPLLIMENDNFQITITTAITHMVSVSPEMLVNSNNIIANYSTKRSVPNGHLLHNVDSSGDNILEGEIEDPHGEHTPFLTMDSTTALLLRAMDSSRTNPASPNDDQQVKSSSATTKQNPVAV